MDSNTIIISSCIFAIILIGLVFKIKIWKIVKLIINSILGGILIYFINLIGTSFGLHIGLNVVTSMVIGVFGIPGAILLLALKIF